MLLSRQKDKGTSCLLVFLSVCLPSEIICVGYLRHENRICTNTDQWTVGAVVSETELKQSVGNMSKLGQHFNSEHVELEEELDEEKRLLGQGRDFDTLIHHKETYLHLADTCNNDLQRILRSIVETYYQIFPKYDKRALSLETGLGLGVELTGHILDFVREYEKNRRFDNLDRKIEQGVVRLDLKTDKVREDFIHFADQTVSVHTKLFDQIKLLNYKINNFVKEIYERIDYGNKYIFHFMKCQNGLNLANELFHYAEDVLEAFNHHKYKLPSTILLKSQAAEEITKKFQERTLKEAYFSPKESYKIVQFAKFSLTIVDGVTVLLGTYRIPTKEKTHSLYSYTSQVEYIPEDDLFCKIEDEEGLILTETNTVGEISQEQLNRCPHSDEIIVCDDQITFHSMENETCASALLSNASHSQISKTCKLECHIGDRPVVVPLNSGNYSITVKSTTTYLKICGGEHVESLELETGNSVINVKQGCTVHLDNYYFLPGGAVHYQDQELALKIPNITLKGILESKKKSQEHFTEVVDDLDFESIEKSIQNLKIPIVTRDSGLSYQITNDGGLTTNELILACALLAALLCIIILLCCLLCKGRGRSSNEGV